MKKLGIMLVAIFLVTLVFSAIGCGGGGEATATPPRTVTQSPSATATPKATQTPVTSVTPTEITLVSPDRLGELLPAAPPAWQQAAVSRQEAYGTPDHKVSMAGNQYLPQGSSASDPNGVAIELWDGGAYYPTGNIEGAQQTTVHGYPAWKLVKPETRYAYLEVAINNRFRVDITCQYEAVLDQFSDLIDYAGIAALKYEPGG